MKSENNTQRPIDTLNQAPQAAKPIDLQDIDRRLKVVTAVPTSSPKKFYDTIVLYVDSVASPTVFRVYFYNEKTKAWKYAALT